MTFCLLTGVIQQGIWIVYLTDVHLFTSIRQCFSSIGHFVFLSGTYRIFPYICAQNQYSDTNGKFQ